MKKFACALAVLLLTAGILSAFDTTAFQFSTWAPKAQLVPPEIAVSGLKLNLPYGSNYSVTGLDIGICSINNAQGDEYAAQVSALQVNLFNSTDGDFSGIQVGLVNCADNASGLLIGGFCNLNRQSVSGLQIGLVNKSMNFTGIAIGLVNYTEFLTGIQIGLINIAAKSTLPVFPIINICF